RAQVATTKRQRANDLNGTAIATSEAGKVLLRVGKETDDDTFLSSSDDLDSVDAHTVHPPAKRRRVEDWETSKSESCDGIIVPLIMDSIKDEEDDISTATEVIQHIAVSLSSRVVVEIEARVGVPRPAKLQAVQNWVMQQRIENSRRCGVQEYASGRLGAEARRDLARLEKELNAREREVKLLQAELDAIRKGRPLCRCGCPAESCR
ncbi:hypothetical protein BKA82DRAFT_17467, partial [Pisolithus tinctorius]